MKKHLSIHGKLDDDGSDALSTATNNSGRHSHGVHSPSALHQHNYEETESLGDGSKKIRKKRNAYQKIEDDVRLKLLEAVQKHGETLKSAAKKYKINYSSAKSILHTYRKEGRILKKSAQERNVKRNATGGGDMEEESPGIDEEESNMETLPNTNNSQKPPHQSNAGRMEEIHDSKENVRDTKEDGDISQKSLNAMNGIMDSFTNLIKLGKNASEAQNESTGKRFSHQVLTPKVSNKPSIKNVNNENAKTNPNKNNSISSKEESQANSALPAGFGNLINPVNLANLANLSHLLQGNSADRLKLLENLYTNQSTSPLAATNPIAKDLSEIPANQIGVFGKELENFAEVVNSLQTQPKQNDEIMMPHPVRFNTAQLMQEKIESQLSHNEDADWNGTIENAAIETFKSFMDAQLLLCDALKKASYLNNLMQMQKSRPEASPKAAQGQTQTLKNP